ncbi:MAG: hypothetical protein IKW96_10320 [Ruminococcus sp.]|uniref:hypothetical protein n=1 Tax=Ruminococcus sp. TaxID=41978 RepID=UPI0025D90F39|nr:hypothetical protein [Ruminococcus sp.]MBR5683645.1 hypothetical protein [Ruminococcus sp.]
MDIDLYIDSVYHGFYRLADIEARFEEYRSIAEEAAKDISDDEVILYAVYAFDEKTQRFLYANFMIKKLKLAHYAGVCGKLSHFCRLFCTGNG